MKNDRAIEFYQELTSQSALGRKDWEIFSGAFNRRLRNAILCAKKKEKIYLTYVFSYWQIQNRIRETNSFDMLRLKELNKQANDLRMEIFNGK